jgi:type I restriction enzyme, S subunit
MKNGWSRLHLSDVASVQSGAGFPEKYQGQLGQEIPFYKVSDMNIAGNELEMIYENNSIADKVRRELGAFLFPKGSVIFPKIGGAIATNKKRLTTRDCCVDNNVMGVVPKAEKVNSSFLYYFFLAHDLSEFANEAHLPSIKKTVVEDWPIILPTSLSEQQRIVGILDQAFDGIATAKANAEKNLQSARALFESHLNSVFTQRGEGWMERPLGELAAFRNGINYTKDSKGERVKIVGVKDFQKNYWVPWQNLDTVMIDGTLNELDLLRRGDILAVRSNGNLELIGRCILAEEAPGKVSHSGFTIRIRLLTVEVLPEYLCHFMKCTDSRKRLVEGGTGTNIKSLNQQTLSALRVPFPSSSEQEALIARLRSISEETQRLESIYQQKLAALEELKKSLLHQAFSGAL